MLSTILSGDKKVIQIRPGDLIAVSASSKFYYALILDRIRLFGGNWTFVFHRTSAEPLAVEEILAGPREGFHAFVDFIWAKREGRITRIARAVDTTAFQGPGFLKATNAHREKATLWFISDMAFREVRRVEQLTPEERRYPLQSRIDDILMVRDVDRRWVPEKDPRI